MARTKENELAVFAHIDGRFVPAGLLSMTEEGSNVLASSFMYGKLYLNRPNATEIDPVSLSLDGARDKLLLPVEGLTLFGGIRDAAPDGWGRRVIEARLKAQPNSLPESTYLLQAGSNRTGALDVRKDINEPASSLVGAKTHQLSYLLDAATRIEAGEAIPAQLEDIFGAGSGSGGMRPKASVDDDDGVTWLAKFPSKGESLDVPCLEEATMRLASLAELDVPDVRLEQIGGRSVMLIKRFDRYLVDGVQHRHHVISALTMLGCHESESRTKSYWDIAASIRAHTPASMIKESQKELFGRMVFNILVTNDDDHLRNHAFLWDSKNKGWTLSPLYDVMPHPAVSFERNLHLSIGMQGRAATLDNALSGYANFGITFEDAIQIIDRIWSVVREWKVYFESFGVPESEINKISTAFRHIDDVLSRNTLKK